MKENRIEKVVLWITLTLFLVGVVGVIGYILIDQNRSTAEAKNYERINDEVAELVVLPPRIEEQPNVDAEVRYQPETGSKVVETDEVDTDINVTEIPTPEATPTEGAKKGGPASASSFDLQKLYALNPDIAGWIRIPGTEIDYPFAGIGDKPCIYLDTAYDGKTKSDFGTLFTRNNLSDPSSISNLVMFGHNMMSPGYGMFTQLMKYKDKSFAKNHSRLELIIGNTPLVYEFFCAYNIKSNDAFHYEKMAFVGPKDLTAYSEEILSRSKVKADGAVAGEAHYVSLSTCDRPYDSKEGRFVVVFVRR